MLLSLSLLLVETASQSITNFSFNAVLSYVQPLVIFGGLALGNILGLFYFSKLDTHKQYLMAIWSIVVMWIGIIYFPQLCLVWFFVPFIGFGIIFVSFYSHQKLMQLVLGVGLMGGIYFCLSFFSHGSSGESLLFSALFCVFITLIFRRKTVALVFAGLILSFVLVGWKSGQLEIPSVLARVVPAFENAEMTDATQFNLLFRTDLVWLPGKDTYSIMLNGSRLAILSSSPLRIADENFLHQKEGSPSYIAPYFFNKGIRNVLVIGSAEGSNVRAALSSPSVESVDAVDINPAVFYYLKDLHPEYTSDVYLNPKVHSIRAEGRHYLETTQKSYDLITLQGVQTGAHLNQLSTPLLESFLFTKEALFALWNKTSENGIIYFDEYLHMYGSTTLLSSLAMMAEKYLPLDSNSQIVLFNYGQSKLNPISTSEKVRPRQGLIISKSKLQNLDDLKSQLSQNYPVTFTQFSGSRLFEVTDNKPFFIQSLAKSRYSQQVLGFFFFLCCLAIFLCWRFLETQTFARHESKQSVGLLFLGAAYILFTISFIGPLSLLSGEPFVSGPVIYLNLYVVSLIGGLLVLRWQLPALKKLFLASALTLIICWLGLWNFKSQILQIDSLSLRIILISLCMASIAMLFEIPYIYALKSSMGTKRGLAYTFENLGCLIGSLIALVLQPLGGFWFTFVIGFGFLMGAVYFLSTSLVAEKNIGSF